MTTDQKFLTSETLLIVSLLLIGTFLSTLNLTNINIALPTLISYFETDMATVQWIVVGFMLTNGLIMPAIGYFTDRFGGRNLFTFGLLALAVSSALCAIAPNIYASTIYTGISVCGKGTVIDDYFYYIGCNCIRSYSSRFIY